MTTQGFTFRKAPLAMPNFNENDFTFTPVVQEETTTLPFRSPVWMTHHGKKAIDCPQCQAKGRRGYIMVFKFSDGRFTDLRFKDGGEPFCMPCNDEKILAMRGGAKPFVQSKPDINKAVIGLPYRLKQIYFESLPDFPDKQKVNSFIAKINNPGCNMLFGSRSMEQKTAYLAAICNRIASVNGGLSVGYFDLKLIAANLLGRKNEETSPVDFVKIDVLAIDNIGAAPINTTEESVLYNIFAERDRIGKVNILASTFPESALTEKYKGLFGQMRGINPLKIFLPS